MLNRLYLLVIILIFFQGCKVDEDLRDLTGSGYPKEIAAIIVPTCATVGCHNEKSKEAAAGLSLVTWETMFQGSRSGAVTIPYQHSFSPLFLFTNVYDHLGVSLKPTMPIGKEPLTEKQVETLRDWIDKGAPNANGDIKFSGKRKKIYVTNQGCDVVAVIDHASGLIMRYIKVGHTGGAESPHTIKISPDGKYWYVVFVNSNVIQRYSTLDDSFIGQAIIGQGSWNTFTITPNGKNAFVTDFDNNHIAYVDLSTMKLLFKYSNYIKPHGIDINKAGNTLYVTAQQNNYIYKIDITDPASEEFQTIDLKGGSMPHEILVSPDEKKYFVTCQASNDVRIFNSINDSLLAVIPTGDYPQEIALSKTYGLAFITSPEDTTTFPGKRGSVTIFNYHTHSVIKRLFTGFQPHGIAVDDATGIVYVANRNVTSAGPAPHHSTSCEGRNGYLTKIDMNTLELIPKSETELSSDPYFISISN